MKFLKFKEHANGVVTISNNDNTEIGSIHPKGEVFKKSKVFLSFDDLTEWTLGCLREVTNFMDAKKAKQQRSKFYVWRDKNIDKLSLSAWVEFNRMVEQLESK